MWKFNRQRRLVSVRYELSRRPEQEEARVVFAAIFQVFAQNDSTIVLKGAPASDRRASWIARADNLRHATRRILRDHAPYLRIGFQKTPALFQRDRVRLNRGN